MKGLFRDAFNYKSIEERIKLIQDVIDFGVKILKNLEPIKNKNILWKDLKYKQYKISEQSVLFINETYIRTKKCCEVYLWVQSRIKVNKKIMKNLTKGR